MPCRVAKFVCERCSHSMWVPNEGGRVAHPQQCANQHCASKHTLVLAHAQSLFSDKQLIKIQESPNLIPEGETPHAVSAFVYDALVDFVRPGDRVTITGASLHHHRRVTITARLCAACATSIAAAHATWRSDGGAASSTGVRVGMREAALVRPHVP
jgi:DNA replicative helicase MCM subunit Mcm2 (Cdc46/Mcm family)